MNKRQRLLYQIGKRDYEELVSILGEGAKLDKVKFIRDFASYHNSRKSSMEWLRGYNQFWYGGKK